MLKYYATFYSEKDYHITRIAFSNPTSKISFNIFLNKKLHTSLIVTTHQLIKPYNNRTTLSYFVFYSRLQKVLNLSLAQLKFSE